METKTKRDNETFHVLRILFGRRLLFIFIFVNISLNFIGTPYILHSPNVQHTFSQKTERMDFHLFFLFIHNSIATIIKLKRKIQALGNCL